MAKEVVVYHQPDCPPCHAAMQFLTEQGIPFTAKDVTKDAEAVQELIRVGATSTPTIRVGEEWMIGFRKEKLLAMLKG